MSYSRHAKLAIAVCTVLPVVVTTASVAIMVRLLLQLDSGLLAEYSGEPIPANLSGSVDAVFEWVPWITGANILATLDLLVLAFVYIAHVRRNLRLAPGQRTRWILLILVTGPFAMVPYFVRHLWRDGDTPQSLD